MMMMINQKDKQTQDDRGRDGGTNFILRIKEQETCLTLLEHDDDDEPKDEETQDDRGRDGGTNFILRIKEQETCLSLQEHDDDNDEL